MIRARGQMGKVVGGWEQESGEEWAVEKGAQGKEVVDEQLSFSVPFLAYRCNFVFSNLTAVYRNSRWSSTKTGTEES